ncbi:AMP-binding protein [Cupriavidus necator]|uniref:AMP-binding protein n=1 Tax=Cupriavidus necator TaxID=106590 RepID=A0A1U9V050_CUPNE|nr:class I adenylate-forming enzyme family protein [Cupriavidus necator]AQV98312.1 AMP-binding protein [Cupriavidus necator]
MSHITELLVQGQARLTAPGAPFELEQARVRGRDVVAYRHAARTLPEFLAAGRAHGDKPFMVYEDQRWSFARFYAAVDALAWQLRENLGVRPGTRVAIAMRNRPEWAVAFVAVAALGAVPAPVNSYGLRDELVGALGLVDAELLFCDQDRLARVEGDLARLGCRAVLVDGEPGPGSAVLSLRALLDGAPADVGPAAPAAAVSPDDDALILFTSGSNCHAKGVLSSQRAVCQALFNIDYIGALAAQSSPELIAGLMARGVAPAALTVVPLFHVSGLHAQLLAGLRHGRRVVFMPRWDPAAALKLIAAERITQFNGAPSMVMQLLAEPGFDEPASTGTLAGIGFGGAGLPQRVIDDVLGKRPDCMAGVGFGLTETNGVGAGVSGDAFRLRPNSAGMVSPIVELRISDFDGSELPPGEQGEIWLRGVTVMNEYWRNPQGTAQAMHDGWFRTGDIGYVDQDGYLFVVDRIKDVINRNGEKIAAAEIESCLLQHAMVRDAAVFARPDPDTGESVVAVVVARDEGLVTAAQLQAHVRAHLAAYKVPAQIHLRTEPLPRNPAGKLLKPVLKEQYLSA